MKELLKQPLLHFLLIGLALFILFALLNKEGDAENTIIIDQSDLERTIATWEMQWNRPPTAEELTNLLKSNIRQEVFYQEALAMNLDHNDEIIKRRLSQKMEFLSNDLANMNPPTEEELRKFYSENRSKYLSPYRYSLFQIVFTADKSGKDYWTIAENVLKEYSEVSIQEMETKGDALPFPFAFDKINEDQLRIQLGSDFTQSVRDVSLNKWVGPIASGYGAHLVYISERTEPQEQAFESIKNDLFRDFEYEREQQVYQAIYEELKKRYTIEVDIVPSAVISDTFLIELQKQLNTN